MFKNNMKKGKTREVKWCLDLVVMLFVLDASEAANGKKKFFQ